MTSWSGIRKSGLRAAEAEGVKYSPPGSGGSQIRALARELGIDRVELREMEGDAILIERGDGGLTMFLNQSQYRVRHRFSAAHEIAHLLLQPLVGQRAVHRRRFAPHQDPETKKIESLCNDMASAILIPQQYASPMIREMGDTAASVPKMAESFGVSFEAAARRYVSLVADPCAAISWTLLDNGRAKNKSAPWTSVPLRGRWLEIVPPSPGAPIAASGALNSEVMVVTREDVILSTGHGRRKVARRLRNVRVESFGHGQGRYRQIVSFVYPSEDATKS